jgi:hypothetical protein
MHTQYDTALVLVKAKEIQTCPQPNSERWELSLPRIIDTQKVFYFQRLLSSCKFPVL